MFYSAPLCHHLLNLETKGPGNMLSQCLITLLFALGLAPDTMIKKLFAAEESGGEHPADTIDSVRLFKKIF